LIKKMKERNPSFRNSYMKIMGKEDEEDEREF
jgi:hypothetical protein